MKKLILLLILSISLFGEIIEHFDTKLVVKDSSTANIKESIIWNFGMNSRHGIYRDIPKNSMRIKNLKVYQNGMAAEYKLMDRDKFWRIRIGSANRYVSGVVKYELRYNLIGQVVRPFGNKNYIIADLIGTGFKKPIKLATATVYLPKALQNKNITIKAFRGKFGSKEPVSVKNLGDKLVLRTTNLAPNEGVTVSISFSPSLMKAGEKPNDRYWENPIYYLFLAPILALFYYFGKRFNIFKDIGSIAPKYRPPNDLTVLEAGLLKDNFVEFTEIKPAILELANLGYIKIEEDSDGVFLKKINSDTSKLNSQQIKILNAIFGESEIIPNDSIRIDSQDFESIKEDVHNALVDKGYFGSSVKSVRESFKFAAFGIGLLSISAFFYYVYQDTIMEKLIPLGASILFIVIGIFNLIGALKSKDVGALLFSILWIGFSGIFLYTAIGSKDLLISLLLMLIVIAIGSFLIYKRLNTLTFKGVLAKRHLLGLKEFIDKADKDKIKFFLNEDKKYLDKMLPYAVLFGLNSHWLNLYKELETPLPDWYDGSFSSFDRLDFEPSIFTQDNSSFLDSIPNSPSINPGDFGGFGDFSGGGFGGGGGDSW